MAIVKTTLTVTVLREVEADSPPFTGTYNLSDIAGNIYDGPWLGSWEVQSDAEVPPEQVEAECLALGNDGAFFNTED